ncbi:MAG: PorT family protein [Bacteroidetes bacterium]|nr:PorT family protein [Bacteroidota bacterium]MBS1541174.1 PorT family protein [Bacteroidota bacterium]
MKLMVKVFLIGLACSVSQLVSAQSVGIGIKGGLNFANLSGSQSLSGAYNNRTGYHFGAFALFKLGKIGIQPEILYSKQGSSYAISTTNFDANFDYINVPILFKLYTVAGINLQVGPQLGFASGGQLTSTFNGVTVTKNYSQLIKNNDFSLAMGLGWDLPFGLSIDARYNLGLSNNNNTAIAGEIKNQVIMASVGYRLFKLGK